MGVEHLHAVIMAGGRGTRFWPLSTRRHPKQLLRITSERTMIQETAARLTELLPPERIWVVTGAQEAPELRAQVPEIPGAQILVEPVGRNTAPCIGLAAGHVRRRDPDAVMAVLPADHHIADPDTFRAALEAGYEAVRDQPVLLTLGMAPTAPETGYGYIQRGVAVGTYGGFEVFEVDRFREKPDRETATRLVEGGDHDWNAGIFMWRAGVIEEEIARYLPELGAALEPIGVALDQGGDATSALAEAYERIDGVSIDYGVLERSDRVRVLPCAFGWSDVGSWAALLDLLERDGDGNARSGEALFVDSRNVLAVTDDRLVATVGVSDLVVVVAGQAVLVCPRDRAQDVRQAVQGLEDGGREDLL